MNDVNREKEVATPYEIAVWIAPCSKQTTGRGFRF